MNFLKGRDFLKLLDFSGEEIEKLLTLAEKLKKEKKAGVPHELCKGKNIALISKERARARAAALKSRRTISACT